MCPPGAPPREGMEVTRTPPGLKKAPKRKFLNSHYKDNIFVGNKLLSLRMVGFDARVRLGTTNCQIATQFSLINNEIPLVPPHRVPPEPCPLLHDNRICLFRRITNKHTKICLSHSVPIFFPHNVLLAKQRSSIGCRLPRFDFYLYEAKITSFG